MESNACAEVIHYRKAATQAKQTKKQAKEPTPAVKIFYPNNFLSVLDKWIFKNTPDLCLGQENDAKRPGQAVLQRGGNCLASAVKRTELKDHLMCFSIGNRGRNFTIVNITVFVGKYAIPGCFFDKNDRGKFFRPLEIRYKRVTISFIRSSTSLSNSFR